MTAAFLTIWLVSLLDRSGQAVRRGLYDAQRVRSETGIGAAGVGALIAKLAPPFASPRARPGVFFNKGVRSCLFWCRKGQ